MKFKDKVNSFLFNRNGIDELGIFTMWVYIFVTIFNTFTNTFIGDLTGLLLVILIFFRMFSKNIKARTKENNIHKKITSFLFKPFINIKRNIQDKDHVYKRCHKCKTVLKLPLPDKRGINHAKCPKCKKSLTLITFKKQKIELITKKSK